jgi:hypothetical protein
MREYPCIEIGESIPYISIIVKNGLIVLILVTSYTSDVGLNTYSLFEHKNFIQIKSDVRDETKWSLVRN